MILMYHKVDAWAPTQWWVDAATFASQMIALQDRKVVYLDDYDPNDPSHVVITFDGVYRNVLTFAAPILRELAYPFELFVTSNCIGRTNDFDIGEPSCSFANLAELQALVEHGGRLQWHTRSHARLTGNSSDAAWPKMQAELMVPEDLRALDPRGFGWIAYPHGEFSEEICEEAKRHFRGAVSCDQGNDQDLFKLNRITVSNATNLRRQTICVIVVSHNYGAFLTEAVESVLQQTYMPDSVLIVDDASDDATQDIGTRYQALLPDRIRYMRNDAQLGIVATFNKAVAATQSDFVCFLGADNRLMPDYVEKAMRVLQKGDEKLAIAYTDFALFGPNARQEYLRHLPERQGGIIDDTYYLITFPEFSQAGFLSGNYIHGSAVYRRSAFERVGGYQDQHGRPEDANLFRRMIAAGYTAQKVPKTYLEYRQHSDEQANIVSRTKGELAFYRIYAKRLEFKVKALERSFGTLSPLVRALNLGEKIAFELAVRAAKAWRRLRT